ncbi:MAG: hypothetical protein WA958_04525 [Tunicatimonas sp.]
MVRKCNCLFFAVVAGGLLLGCQDDEEFSEDALFSASDTLALNSNQYVLNGWLMFGNGEEDTGAFAELLETGKVDIPASVQINRIFLVDKYGDEIKYTEKLPKSLQPPDAFTLVSRGDLVRWGNLDSELNTEMVVELSVEGQIYYLKDPSIEYRYY